MSKRQRTVYFNNLKTIDYCGKPAMYQMDVTGIYEVPFEVDPVEGEHDYRTCNKCQENYKSMVSSSNEQFNGLGENEPFPLCCADHRELLKLDAFDRKDFEKVPEMVARKTMYVHQHILNSEKTEDWYKRITHYFEWVLSSFGTMPENCGYPLYSIWFFDVTRQLLIDCKDFDKEKKETILNYLNSFFGPERKGSVDFNLLISTYQKWMNIFPFELNSYFGKLEQHYRNTLPILNGEIETNMYSGISKAKIHTQSSLIEALIKLTDDILTHINGLQMYEAGLITDANKIKLDLAIHSRKLKLKEGYKSKAQGEEQKYRKILKAWFKDEKKFINEITPLLKTEPTQKKETKSEIFESSIAKHGFFDLPKTKGLSKRAKDDLIQKMNAKGMPYSIAMFNFLGFLDHLSKEHYQTKYKLYREVSKWFDSDKDGRAIKGNMGVLSQYSKESRRRYTAHSHKENVIIDYQNLK